MYQELICMWEMTDSPGQAFSSLGSWLIQPGMGESSPPCFLLVNFSLRGKLRERACRPEATDPDSVCQGIRN